MGQQTSATQYNVKRNAKIVTGQQASATQYSVKCNARTD